ncbi:hypothetical protein Y900_011435 [Mycolicibacterium aromaticivorans JS19b1 = JCM 16368]|uniref:Putative regulatory protein FmdB zinc ribbon domain-containing protein n=1 Tax=Mycolicibacterium aromaticivorans JS19b1 = JCM 16368 TaxID=1440774 RepID=A0A064CGR1_9MYCO|nr:FmdB family zinc ribbon protein [Mycolicibacterium aromaticivorans]KDE99535.1 hypothetical protein Y900_011435 [Mycolicibacterium aromaticivorans JS19b1 = JCM 16368]
MPTYQFRCPGGCPDFSAIYPMADVPGQDACPRCAAPARRLFGAPALGVGRTAAMQLQDRTRASAEHPDVVQRLPGAGRRNTPVTTNPLHRRLPRP